MRDPTIDTRHNYGDGSPQVGNDVPPQYENDSVLSSEDSHLATPPASPPAYESTSVPTQFYDRDVKRKPCPRRDSWTDSVSEVNSSAWTATSSTPSAMPSEPHSTPPNRHDSVSCTLLPEKPAMFEVPKHKVKLSGLAVTVLLKENIIKAKDLEVLPHLQYEAERDPTDPLSGVFLAAYDTVEQIMYGVAEGPITAATSKNPAKGIAVGAGKGLGRIIGTSLKAPMSLSYGIARGFHNTPKMYGDEVRDVGKITGVQTGLLAAAKGLGFGLYDGITGVFVQPYQGAEREGGVGFIKGVGKGLGGVVCKPAAGAVGIAGYTFRGVYKEIRGESDMQSSQSLAAVLLSLGEEEWNRSTSAERLEIITRWYKIKSRQ